MNLPFVGPSYTVFDGRASRSRAVNLFLAPMENPSKAQFVMASAPGLIQRSNAGSVVRGAINAGDRAFFVAGSTLYELDSAFGITARGTLATSSGEVGMAWGLAQLVIVDGPNGYVLRLSSNIFERITDEDWPGSRTVDYLNGFFTLIPPDTQQAYVTAIDDATNVDALDYVSAESVPDKLTGQVCLLSEWWLLGAETSEPWTPVPSQDFPFARSTNTISRVGCLAPFTVKRLDNTFMMLGRDENGAGMVYQAQNLRLAKVSTQAVDQALAQSTDLSAAVAWVYQQDGLTFYCINAPGLTSTWCYELLTKTWHERCDLAPGGGFAQGRITHHIYAFGRNVGFDASGRVYQLDRNTYTLAGDPLIRLRVSANNVTPTRERQFFAEFVADVTTGKAPQGQEFFAELAYSNDGGLTWGNWIRRSTGRVGQYFARLLWTRLGMGRDRVWRLRYEGNTPFTIVSAEAR